MRLNVIPGKLLGFALNLIKPVIEVSTHKGCVKNAVIIYRYCNSFKVILLAIFPFNDKT